MKQCRAALLAALLIGAPILAPTAGWSQTADPIATPRIDQRAQNQAKRTDQGVASGNLTKTEAARLKRQQARIQKREAAAKSDGVVTSGEKRRLTAAQNGESRRIARQKHDAQKAVN
ncbi:MAG: hypothetical protein ACOVVK_10310 [Elsteraceae bacterium]